VHAHQAGRFESQERACEVPLIKLCMVPVTEGNHLKSRRLTASKLKAVLTAQGTPTKTAMASLGTTSSDMRCSAWRPVKPLCSFTLAATGALFLTIGPALASCIDLALPFSRADLQQSRLGHLHGK
jgi:hypothetical protein